MVKNELPNLLVSQKMNYPTHFSSVPTRGINSERSLSDHFSQFCFFKSGKEKALPVKTKIRDFSYFYESSFLHDLQQVDWDSLVAHDNDINKTFTTFYNRFNKIVNKHAPIKIAKLNNLGSRGLRTGFVNPLRKRTNF